MKLCVAPNRHCLVVNNAFTVFFFFHCFLFLYFSCVIEGDLSRPTGIMRGRVSVAVYFTVFTNRVCYIDHTCINTLIIKVRWIFIVFVGNVRNMSRCVWSTTQLELNDCFVLPIFLFNAIVCCTQNGPATQIKPTPPLISASWTQQEQGNVGFWGKTAGYYWFRAQQGLGTISFHVKYHQFSRLVENWECYNTQRIDSLWAL